MTPDELLRNEAAKWLRQAAKDRLPRGPRCGARTRACRVETLLDTFGGSDSPSSWGAGMSADAARTRASHECVRHVVMAESL